MTSSATTKAALWMTLAIVLFPALAGFFLFAEIPGLWTILGAAVIFGATYYVTWRERHGP